MSFIRDLAKKLAEESEPIDWGACTAHRSKDEVVIMVTLEYVLTADQARMFHVIDENDG